MGTQFDGFVWSVGSLTVDAHTTGVHPRKTRLTLNHLYFPIVLAVTLVTHWTEVAFIDELSARRTQREVVCPLVCGTIARCGATAAATLHTSSAQLKATTTTL